MRKYATGLLLFLAVSLLALTACGRKGPEPISFGSDNCAECQMTASDARFGAEMITRKGKIYKFDSVECLAGSIAKRGQAEEVGSLWVVDFAHPSHLIDAASAFYLQSDKLHSPMGLNLSAFGAREGAAALQGENRGTILRWPEVVRYVGQKRS